MGKRGGRHGFADVELKESPGWPVRRCPWASSRRGTGEAPEGVGSPGLGGQKAWSRRVWAGRGGGGGGGGGTGVGRAGWGRVGQSGASAPGHLRAGPECPDKVWMGSFPPGHGSQLLCRPPPPFSRPLPTPPGGLSSVRLAGCQWVRGTSPHHGVTLGTEGRGPLCPTTGGGAEGTGAETCRALEAAHPVLETQDWTLAPSSLPLPAPVPPLHRCPHLTPPGGTGHPFLPQGSHLTLPHSTPPAIPPPHPPFFTVALSSQDRPVLEDHSHGAHKEGQGDDCQGPEAGSAPAGT